MKYVKMIFLAMVVGAVAVACGNNAHDHDHDHDGTNTGEATEMHHQHDGDAATSTQPAEGASTVMQAHGNGPEYTSPYVCPMHCKGSGSDKPGKCPVCGMDYVPLKEHMKDGHKH